MNLLVRTGFLFLAVSSPLSFAATIRSLSLQGNAVFTTREITGWLSSRAGAPYAEATLRKDLDVILQNYRAQGYLATRASLGAPVFSSDSSFVELTIALEEGRQTLIAGVRIHGASRLNEAEILEQLDVGVGVPMNETLLERDIDALLLRYEKLGYPLARCAVESLDARPGAKADSVLIVLRVEEGAPLSVDEIRVEGNKETDASVIVRETRLEPGEPYNPAKINAIRQRLTRLDIFSSVAEPELYVRNNHGGLLIKVKEGNTNTFDGVIGYIPPAAQGQSGYVTGLASVSMRNMFGTGRKLSLRWQREDRSSQEIGVRYVEPWILGLPLNIGAGFFQRQQDSSYVRRTFDVKTEFMFSEELSVALVLNTNRVIPSGDSTGVTHVLGLSEITGGAEIQYDTRDDIYSPSSGAHYRTDYYYGHKSVTSVPGYVTGLAVEGGTIQRLGVDLDFYMGTFPRQIVAVGLHGREVRTVEVQESEMYRFGGATTLRGYRENEFLGARVAWTNAEYRFILARRSFLFGFFDTGYYSRPGDDIRGLPSADGFRYGYGVGIRLETPLGNMAVSFALGQGDSFGTAKIHIGLINEF